MLAVVGAASSRPTGLGVFARDAANAGTDRGPRSGPAVARLFQRLLALVFLAAWWSLHVQLDELLGSHGLLPLAPFLAGAAERGWPTVAGFPTLFWLGAGDTALQAGVWAGVVLALAAFAGLYARVCFGLSTALYLSYAVGGRTFFSFQWDNLLLECGLFAVFLATDRDARWIHVLFRVLLFKLYWESGMAKWQSVLHDWHDGSAMAFYYETAPLPTWIAWHAHALPAWWHRLESWATLAMELALPFGIFGPRRVRRFTFAVLTAFQAVNASTANYGFFCYLSASLHVFLLGDRDLCRAAEWLRTCLPLGLRTRVEGEHPRPAVRSEAGMLRRLGAVLLFTVFVAVSVADGLLAFGGGGAWRPPLERFRRLYEPWRLISTYHLFAHITRQRVEPEFQVLRSGEWTPLELRYKPGDPLVAPSFVAPHQPRVDFQLWFYGLGFRRGMPEYVSTLLQRLCHSPEAVEPLFRTRIGAPPQAVRIAFWDYRFTSREERQANGSWWRRRLLGTTRTMSCATFPSG